MPSNKAVTSYWIDARSLFATPHSLGGASAELVFTATKTATTPLVVSIFATVTSKNAHPPSGIPLLFVFTKFHDTNYHRNSHLYMVLTGNISRNNDVKLTVIATPGEALPLYDVTLDNRKKD